MYKGVRVSTLLICVGDLVLSLERKQKRRGKEELVVCVCEAIGVRNHQGFKCGSIIVRKV